MHFSEYVILTVLLFASTVSIATVYSSAGNALCSAPSKTLFTYLSATIVSAPLIVSSVASAGNILVDIVALTFLYSITSLSVIVAVTVSPLYGSPALSVTVTRPVDLSITTLSKLAGATSSVPVLEPFTYLSALTVILPLMSSSVAVAKNVVFPPSNSIT